MAAEIDQIEDVLLETGSAETDAGVQKTGSDAAVGTHSPGHLGYIGLGLFTKGGNGVD